MKYLSSFLFSTLLFFSCQKSENTMNTIVPISPTDLTINLISSIQADLTWVDKSTNETGFKIERKTSTSQFVVIATLGPNVTKFSDNGLSENSVYTYRIYAYNSAGNSPSYTNEFNINTTNIKSGLVGYFPFTGNANDSSGNNIATTLWHNAILTKDRFGNNASAFSFTSNPYPSSWITGTLKNPLGSIFSISFWAKRNTSLPTGSSYDDIEWFFACGEGSPDKKTQIGIPRGSKVLVYGPAAPSSINSNYGIDDTWTHYVETYSNGIIKIYVNGKLISSANYTMNLTSGLFFIGVNEMYAREGFNGAIDEVRLYNLVLSEGQISYLSKN
jgi:hypothetical protein